MTINPAATADRLRKAPGPARPPQQNGSTPREPSLGPSLFSNMDNGHVDWSFPRQGSYGSLSSAAHNARVSRPAYPLCNASHQSGVAVLRPDIP